MLSSYPVKDLIDQNAESERHRVATENGEQFVLSRLKFAPELLAGLFGENVFEGAMAQLKSLKSEHLQEVTDGGMDEDDGSPWIRSAWIEGKAVSEQKLGEKDIRELEKQGQELMKDLGAYASAVNFDPAHILAVRKPDGVLHSFFSIDYSRWFRNAAAGDPYQAGQDPETEVRRLLEGLVIQQLKPAKKGREKAPLPFVEDRSPALTAYQAPRTRWFLSALAWVGLFLTLAVIAWLTLLGMKRAEQNPRKEVPAWNAPSR